MVIRVGLEIKNIKKAYFSGTGTTKKIVEHIGMTLTDQLNKKENGGLVHSTYDFTRADKREKSPSYDEGDLVIVGVPIYAGRVPNVLLKFLNRMEGNGALAVPVVLYGNRNYDDGLVELRDILIARGFRIIAGAAFIGEHSFSKTLAASRPDEMDLEVAKGFAEKIVEALMEDSLENSVWMEGCSPYRPYYRPRNKQGESVDIRRVKPKTNADCTDCKICVEICPMGSINCEEVGLVEGICIKCGACIKGCPVHAKYYDDLDYLRHKEELEAEFVTRRSPELFF